MPFPQRPRPAGWTALAAVPILLGAALLRLWALDRLPGGLHFDLAANLFDVTEILDGARPLFFPRNTGREPLIFYLQALSAAVLGVTPFAARLVTVVFGVLSVAAVGFAARQAARLAWPTDRARGEAVALIAAGLLAGLYWSVHFSRFGLRTALMPFWLALGFGLVLRGLRREIVAGVPSPNPRSAPVGDQIERPRQRVGTGPGAFQSTIDVEGRRAGSATGNGGMSERERSGGGVGDAEREDEGGARGVERAGDTGASDVEAMDGGRASGRERAGDGQAGDDEREGRRAGDAQRDGGRAGDFERPSEGRARGVERVGGGPIGRRPTWWGEVVDWGGAGLCLGLALDTYIGGRIAPAPFLLPVALGCLLWPGWRWLGRGLLLVGAAALAAWPLIFHFLPMPEQFVLHRADVLVIDPTHPAVGGGLAAGVVRTAAAFVLRGSPGLAENLPGRPLFDPPIALAFLVGLAIVLGWLGQERARAMAAATLLGWLIVMALPSALTEPSPGFVRISGAIAPAVILAALGLSIGRRWLVGRLERRRPGVTRTAGVLAGAMVLLSALWTARDYFVVWGGTFAYEASQSAKAEAAAWLAEQQATDRVFLSPLWATDLAVQYITRARPLERFAAGGLVIPTDRRRGALYGFAPEETHGLDELRQRLPAEARREVVRDASGQHEILQTLRLAAEDLPPPPIDIQRIEDGLGQVGADFPAAVAPGQRFAVTIHWYAVARPSQDYTAFVQLRRDGVTRAQHDGQPLGGAQPTSRWQPGDLVLDAHPLVAPPDLTPGRYTLHAGLYRLADRQRLHLLDARGQIAPFDEIRLGEIEVRPAG